MSDTLRTARLYPHLFVRLYQALAAHAEHAAAVDAKTAPRNSDLWAAVRAARQAIEDVEAKRRNRQPLKALVVRRALVLDDSEGL